jgi:cytochrome c oxidase subunit 3
MNTMTQAGIHVHKDYTGAKMGMWLFLVAEMLLFVGMFLLYSGYRATHAAEFHAAATELNTLVGTINTLVLLTSSLTMALAVTAVQRGNKRLSMLFMLLTMALGVIFLGDKYYEWSTEIHRGIYPGSPALAERSYGEMLFFGLYFTMTGLHGLHVAIGIVVIGVMVHALAGMPSARTVLRSGTLGRMRGTRISLTGGAGGAAWEGDVIDDTVREVEITVRYSPVETRMHETDFVKIESTGLYWHLVDIIWIFLFPLFYLIT